MREGMDKKRSDVHRLGYNWWNAKERLEENIMITEAGFDPIIRHSTQIPTTFHQKTAKLFIACAQTHHNTHREQLFPA